MEVVAVDLDISTDWKVSWSNELHVVVDILVLVSLKEWTFNDTRVLLSWFEDGDGIISKVERDDKSSVDVFWDLSVESSSVSQDLFVIVDVLEEVNLWLLWDKFLNITKRVLFITETIVWWNLKWNLWNWSWLFNVTEFEVSLVLISIVLLSESIDTSDFEVSTVSIEVLSWEDLICGKVSISNEDLTWLLHVEVFWESLSSQVDGMVVSSVIWEKAFSDLDSIIGKEVVPDVL